MRTMGAVLGFIVAVSSLVRAAQHDRIDRQTLEAARLLTSLEIGRLPIDLTSVLPDSASPGIEGWTIPRTDGKGERIFVYTGSDIFRCASKGENYQCRLRLASIIVHEAWHFKHGPSERGAYAAQTAF